MYEFNDSGFIILTFFNFDDIVYFMDFFNKRNLNIKFNN